MTPDHPQDVLQRFQVELAELSVRLADLAGTVQTLSATLLPDPAGPARGQPGRLEAGPTEPEPAGVGHSPSPRSEWAPPPAYAPVSASRRAPEAIAAAAPDGDGGPASPPPPLMSPVPATPRRRGRRISVAELFSVVGSAITLIGVTFVLVLPQDAALGPLPRMAIAVALAVATVAAAVRQHAKDPRNLGAQALLATGVASAYLCVLAGTVLFVRPDGRGLVPDAIGLTLAGLISIGGLWTARRWDSQWLGVLAVLGSLVLAPFVVQSNVIWGLAFMILLTIVTAPFQLGRSWVVLMAARVKPTTLVFLATAAYGARSLAENASATLVLAAVLAAAGLGMAVLHQHDRRPNQVASAVALVPMATPAAVTCWLADRPLAAVVCGVLAVLYGICGVSPGRWSPVLRSAAVPIGALFAAFALLRLTGGDHAGSITLGLAVAYLALAARTRSRPVLVVGLVNAAIGALSCLPLLLAALFADEAATRGTEAVAQSLLGLTVAVLAAPALRAFGVRAPWLMSVTWLSSVAFGSVAVVLAGAEAGRLLARPTVGFQTAHALVTVMWLVVCVVLLRLGLRPDRDGPVAVRLALVLAVAAVTKLFLFDLATLPGLVRALAFIVVGVLLLVIGTWYYRQLDRRRRARAGDGVRGGSDAAVPGAPGSPAGAAEARELSGAVRGGG